MGRTPGDNEHVDFKGNYPHRDPDYLMIQRMPEDFVEVDGERISVIRISLGGNAERGHYCVFRGEPGEVIELLEKALWAMRVKFATGPTDPGQGKS